MINWQFAMSAMDQLNPALAADAVNAEDILLIQRKHPPMQGAWALPGGFVERDEDPEVAAIRELFEETGLQGTNPELLMVMGDLKIQEAYCSVVYAVSVSDDQHPVAGDDAQDARFWPLKYVLSGELELAGDHLQIIKIGLIYEFN